jgi:CheY-like chemotaxis protein
VKNIFFIHWNAEEIAPLAAQIAAWGYSVATESEKSPEACRKVAATLPDAVVISLRRYVALGRETARFIGTRRTTKHIPIVFMDGKQDERLERIAAMLPQAQFCLIDELAEVLQQLPDGPAAAAD